ncbi:MAG: hypothetical protein IPJ41_01595 [Phycisphaerales bacterium]|nr:hypothetical protein [Phycisphaerales bacterium]
MSTSAHIKKIAGTATMAVALWTGVAGCTSVIYDSNPEGPASQLEEKPDFASHTVQNLLATSVRWAVENYPPPGDQGWFAVNLPRGLTREQYIKVAEQISDHAAPITPELDYLPTYHVGWVWMRGDHARVDVMRPVYMLSSDDKPVFQTITLHLRRRYASWRVERTQPWDPGVVPLPPIYDLPPEEVPAGTQTSPAGAAPTEDSQPTETNDSSPPVETPDDSGGEIDPGAGAG